MVWDGVLIFITVITAIVIWLRWNYNHWKKKGISYVEPSIIFGNFKEMIVGNLNAGIMTQRYYEMFPGEPVVGLFMMRKPQLLVKDIELVKSILVNNFANFRDNGMDISKEADPIVGRNPFFLKGDEWKEARRKHTHNHTASKLKTMFGYVEEVNGELVEYVRQHEGKKYDAQDFCSRFTTDVVSSCVFGVKIRSHAGEDSDFRKYANNLIPSSWKLVLFGAAPTLFNRFRIPLISTEGAEFFQNIVENVVESRKKQNLSRADFLQNFVSDESEGFTPVEMTAQALTFFMDGYLTSSTEMSFVLYMLAIHPEVQTRLRNELSNAKALDFETIHSLPYLDAVINETLRLYPAGTVLVRVCNEEITLHARNKKIHFNVGDSISIPVYAIHRDPENFPDPLTFNPDRFLDQPNHPALLTFGTGPRACFGQRFAKTQIKSGVANLVKHFKILPGTEDYSMPKITNNKHILITSDSDMSLIFKNL